MHSEITVLKLYHISVTVNCVIVVNGADFDEMLQSAASHLVLHSLSKYMYLICLFV